MEELIAEGFGFGVGVLRAVGDLGFETLLLHIRVCSLKKAFGRTKGVEGRDVKAPRLETGAVQAVRIRISAKICRVRKAQLAIMGLSAEGLRFEAKKSQQKYVLRVHISPNPSL